MFGEKTSKRQELCVRNTNTRYLSARGPNGFSAFRVGRAQPLQLKSYDCHRISFFRGNTTEGWLSRRYFWDALLLMFLVRDPGMAGLRINRTSAGCLTDNFEFPQICQILAKHSPTFCNRLLKFDHIWQISASFGQPSASFGQPLRMVISIRQSAPFDARWLRRRLF